MQNDYTPPSTITVTGATAPSGKPYIRVDASGKSKWISREDCTGSGRTALRALSAAGIPLLADEWSQCRKKIAELVSYPAAPLIDRPGWNGKFFALPDGTVFPSSKEQKSRPVVLFSENTRKCAKAGTIAQWRKLTALLRDQPLATFVLLIGYVGPFLRFTNQLMNQGFELVGSPGVGKSTLQRLTAAVCGPADHPSGVNYWVTANTTMLGLEPVLADHHDMTLIIEEANLFAATDLSAKRAAQFNALVFSLADGTPKRRFGSPQLPRSRFSFLTSNNESLPQLLSGKTSAVAEAAADRLLTLPIADERSYGVFDCLPQGWAKSRAFAEHINQQIRKCYGVGIRRLLRKLVIAAEKDPEAIARELGASMKSFRLQVGVDENDGSETRVADAFGLVYAVALFAIRFGAVSSQIDPLEAALACYKLNKASRKKKPASYLKQLASLVEDDWDAVYVLQERLKEVTDREIEEARVIIRTRRDERQELLFTHRQLVRSFPDLRAFFADPEIRQLLVAEPGRRQTKRQIRLNAGLERFYCFRMPA
ncbi:MAG: DUF927 domain-containing protein [Croceibacterium sp.]